MGKDLKGTVQAFFQVGLYEELIHSQCITFTVFTPLLPWAWDPQLHQKKQNI